MGLSRVLTRYVLSCIVGFNKEEFEMPRKRLTVKERLTTGAQRKIKNRQKKLDRLTEEYMSEKIAIDQEIEDQREVLRLLKVRSKR